MTTVLDIPKGCLTADVDALGRMWLVIAVPWKTKRVGPLTRKCTAIVDEDASLIIFRSHNRDLAKISVMHELIHICFPTLKEQALDLGDSAIVLFLEAFGVDLYPLVDWAYREGAGDG